MSDKDCKDIHQIKELIVHPKIGEMLLQHNKVSIYQLAEALEEQKTSGKPLGKILIEKGYVSENDLIQVLSLQSNISKLLDDSYSELEKIKSENPE